MPMTCADYAAIAAIYRNSHNGEDPPCEGVVEGIDWGLYWAVVETAGCQEECGDCRIV